MRFDEQVTVSEGSTLILNYDLGGNMTLKAKLRIVSVKKGAVVIEGGRAWVVERVVEYRDRELDSLPAETTP